MNAVKAEKLTNELLNMTDAPTCIFYPDDLSYSGGFNAIKSRGLKVPDDISMVGYDGIKLGTDNITLAPHFTAFPSA